MTQMISQMTAAKGTPIRWEIAEPRALRGMQELAWEAGVGNKITFVLKEPPL